MLHEILMVCKVYLMKDVMGSYWPDFNMVKIEDVYGKYIASIDLSVVKTPKDVCKILEEYQYQNLNKLIC